MGESSGGGRQCGHPPPPLLPSSVDVGALDEEGDPDVGSPLIEVLTAQPRGDDVDRADVAKRALCLFERLLRGVIRRLLGASNQLNDLYDGHEPSSFSPRWVCGKCSIALAGDRQPLVTPRARSPSRCRGRIAPKPPRAAPPAASGSPRPVGGRGRSPRGTARVRRRSPR